jgi:hypothetical protein
MDEVSHHPCSRREKSQVIRVISATLAVKAPGRSCRYTRSRQPDF